MSPEDEYLDATFVDEEYTGYEYTEYEQAETNEDDVTEGMYANPVAVMENLKRSRAALLGFVVMVAAITGLILCYTLPWIDYEGEREIYDEEEYEYIMVSDEESIKYRDLDDEENMERMYWSKKEIEFYEDAAGWAINGFIFLTILGASIYLLAVYQNLPVFERLFGLMSHSMPEGQRRLVALQILAALVVLVSALSLRAVPRFIQLQQAYNESMAENDLPDTIYAGWASVGVILAAGTIMICGLVTLCTVLKAGWTRTIRGEAGAESLESLIPEGGWPKDDKHSISARCRKYGIISLAVVAAGLIGLVLSLAIPTMDVTFKVSDENYRNVFDDGKVYAFKEWSVGGAGDEFESWYGASNFNRVGFQCFIFLGLVSSVGIHFHNSGEDLKFRLLFWGPICIIALLGVAMIISNFLWILNGEELGEAWTAELDEIFGEDNPFKVESKFINNYYPLVISGGTALFLFSMLHFHRREILHGEDLHQEDEAEYDTFPWDIPDSGFVLHGFPGKTMMASICVLFLLTGAFGVYAPDIGVGDGGSGEQSNPAWVIGHGSGMGEDRYLDEYTSEDLQYYIEEDIIIRIEFYIWWEDEDDQPLCENEPDEFRLTVETPWGELKQSEWVQNQHGESASITLTFERENDPSNKGSAGTFKVTVECGECGDQWYTNPHTIGHEDTGNDYTIGSEYDYWKEF